MGKLKIAQFGLKYKTPTERSQEQGLAHNETTPTEKKDVPGYLCT
jgi:hypothetical protein